MPQPFSSSSSCSGPAALLTGEWLELSRAQATVQGAEQANAAQCRWRDWPTYTAGGDLSFVIGDPAQADRMPSAYRAARGEPRQLAQFDGGADWRPRLSPMRVDLINADRIPRSLSRIWRLGILSSHGGTNFHAIAQAIERGHLNASIAVAICNNPGATTFDIAAAHGIPAKLINGTMHADHPDRDSAIQACLEGYEVDVVVLAGYNKRLGESTVDAFPERVLNIHPGPLDEHDPPGKYGGQGMYGDYVHSAVLLDKLAKTASTVHVATRWIDHGPHVLATSVPVRRGDTPDGLGCRVYAAGRQIYWRAIRMHLRRLEKQEAALQAARVAMDYV